MKTLLINPYFSSITKHENKALPLGLMYLASSLEKASFEVDILDASLGRIRPMGSQWHYGYTLDELMGEIKLRAPDIVGIGCFFSMRFPAVLEIAREIKKLSKTIKIVIGGIHPTIFAERILNEHGCFDYVIIGEGEQSIVQLHEVLQSDNFEGLGSIDGIAYRSNNSVRCNSKTTFIEDLDSLPFPAYHLLPIEEYMNNKVLRWGLGANRQFSIITSRSCPNRCTFCSMFLTHGPRWRFRSAENVVDEIELLIKNYQAREISFEDDNLTFSKKRIISICNGIINRGLKIIWNTPNGVSIKHLDYEILAKMKEAGCDSVNLPIESADENMRNKIIKKHLSEDKIYEVIRACNELDLKANAYFVLGMPGETRESLENNIKLLKEVPLNGMIAFFATPFPGTDLFKWVTEDNLVDREDLDKIINGDFNIYNKPLIRLNNISFNDLIKYKNRMMLAWITRNFFDLILNVFRGRSDYFNLSFFSRFIRYYLPSK